MSYRVLNSCLRMATVVVKMNTRRRTVRDVYVRSSWSSITRILVGSLLSPSFYLPLIVGMIGGGGLFDEHKFRNRLPVEDPFGLGLLPGRGSV